MCFSLFFAAISAYFSPPRKPFSSFMLPVGEGLCAFRSADEAADQIRRVAGDYPRHTRAARAIAEEYFDSDKVLSRLLNDAMVDVADGAKEMHA